MASDPVLNEDSPQPVPAAQATRLSYQRMLEYSSSVRFNAIVAGLFALASLSPYILKGKAAALVVNDNLEVLDRFGTIVDGAPVTSSAYLTHWLSHHLGIFWGFVANEMLCRAVAFVGMWYLARRLTRGLAVPRLIFTLTACAFASLRFWPLGDLSVAGVPLAVLALLRLHERRQSVGACVLLVGFAYHSHFSLVGMPLLIITSIFTIQDCVQSRRVSHMAIGVGFLALVYAGKRWLQIDSDQVAALVGAPEVDALQADSFLDTLRRTSHLFTDSVYFAQANQASVMVPSAIGCAAYLFGKRHWPGTG